jgi:hypothetical protein
VVLVNRSSEFKVWRGAAVAFFLDEPRHAVLLHSMWPRNEQTFQKKEAKLKIRYLTLKSHIITLSLA